MVYWQAWFPAPVPASEPYRLITAHSVPSNGIKYIQTTSGAIAHGDQSARHRLATSLNKPMCHLFFAGSNIRRHIRALRMNTHKKIRYTIHHSDTLWSPHIHPFYKDSPVRILFILIGSVLLHGCISTDIHVNVDNRPEPLKGMAAATLISGTFYAEDSKGLYCNGAYDSTDVSPRLQVRFQCSDGRSGSASVSRYGEYLENGSGQGQLSDGTAINVYLGEKAHGNIAP